jgi:hypothetical protein
MSHLDPVHITFLRDYRSFNTIFPPMPNSHVSPTKKFQPNLSQHRPFHHSWSIHLSNTERGIHITKLLSVQFYPIFCCISPKTKHLSALFSQTFSIENNFIYTCVLSDSAYLTGLNVVALGDLVARVLVMEPKIRGFKPDRGRWILRTIKKSVAWLPSEEKQSRQSHLVNFYGMLKNPTSRSDNSLEKISCNFSSFQLLRY